MHDYSYLLSLAIILLSTKVFSSLADRVKLPPVVGALVAGVLIGPSAFGIVSDTSFIDGIAKIGVIILMFVAGLDTDVREIKRNGVSYLVIAAFGVLIPLIGGSLSYIWFFHINVGSQQELLKAIFIGVVLTATSVSITIEALKELGYANSRVGNSILGAAIVDDVIGIVVLTIIISFKSTDINVLNILIKIVVYFVCVFVIGIVAIFFARTLDFKVDKRRISIYAFSFVLLVSYVSEKYFGIADITGAYLVGMIMSMFSVRNYIVKRMNTLSYLFFAPIFFASVGLKTKINGLTSELIIFSVILLLMAILTKIIGAGLGAKICKYNNYEALNIGIGMVSRGEVALIVAEKGYALDLVDKAMFSPVILMVVITTIITPILLKKTIKPPEEKNVITS